MCPNHDFVITSTPVGGPEDFEWLDELIQDLNSTFDATFTATGRYRGECCPAHKDLILCKFDVEYRVPDVRSYLTEKVVQAIYNLVKTYAQSGKSPHQLVHMRWWGYYFVLGLDRK